jgi:hypothetical protein
MRARVAAGMLGCCCKASDTAERETPAWAATSRIETRPTAKEIRAETVGSDFIVCGGILRNERAVRA